MRPWRPWIAGFCFVGVFGGFLVVEALMPHYGVGVLCFIGFAICVDALYELLA
jgi:hypothetical protein